MRLRTWRKHEIGADQAAAPPITPKPATHIGRPARKNWPDQTAATTTLMPRSGCSISRASTRPTSKVDRK